ncbi:MAG: tRNA threonylcarbamoyladenosine dehydratase [Firmicutes bacterium]|nr:tRNA threonylcarbamoyladenosine dehydratase [Bacillota bacterium]
MVSSFYRTELLVGSQGLEQLRSASVAVFGIGGVGSYTVEALARTGIGRIRLVDHDSIDRTNINRQIHALEGTIGQSKVKAMARRLKEINPHIEVEPIQEFYTPETGAALIAGEFCWLVDVMDTVTAKLDIITRAMTLKLQIISAMGAGNKLDASQLRVSDLSKTSNCPLARIMRKELGKRGIRRGLPVVWSPETPLRPNEVLTHASRRQLPGSISYVPAVAGLLIASHIVNAILKQS